MAVVWIVLTPQSIRVRAARVAVVSPSARPLRKVHVITSTGAVGDVSGWKPEIMLTASGEIATMTNGPPSRDAC